MTDLWPEDIWENDPVQIPADMLEEQAELLGSKTKNYVTAKVSESSQSHFEEPDFNYDFFIVAPTLSNYHYRLFTISHDIDLYPLEMDLDEDISKELFPDQDSVDISIQTEEEFSETLRKIFDSRKMKRIMAILRSMTHYDEYSSVKDTDFGPEEIPF